MDEEKDPEQHHREYEGQRHHQDMIREAWHVGPHTVLFIDRLWQDAYQEATWSSLNLLQLARWYSKDRVELAIARALSHGIRGIAGLRYILEHGLDRLHRRQDEDLYGQLLLPLPLPEDP